MTIAASAFALQNRAMDAGAVGLSITYARELPLLAPCAGRETAADCLVSFNDYVLWIVRMYAACEMSMNSVERVGECKC